MEMFELLWFSLAFAGILSAIGIIALAVMVFTIAFPAEDTQEYLDTATGKWLDDKETDTALLGVVLPKK